LIIAYTSLLEKLAKSIEGNFKLVPIITKKFPDGEKYIRISNNVKNEDVIFLHSMALNPDESIMEYLLIIDALRSMECNTITAIIPYIPYLRQDKRFNLGEPLSAKVISYLISLGINKLVTIDPHLHRFKDLSELFKIPCINLSAIPLLVDYYKRNFDINNSIIIGPDIESERLVKIAANILSLPYFIFEKQRISDKEVIVEGEIKELSLKGKNAIIIDDIVSTGGTISKITSILLNNGVNRVDVLVSHCLLSEENYKKLKEIGLNELISTDTIPNPFSKVSIAPLISKVIGEINDKRSN
jgi:ribose-phosphate pyrophosphokinase